jgi:hypothetical protein
MTLKHKEYSLMHKPISSKTVTGIKLLFASGSLVLTLVLWNLFSIRSLRDAAGTPNNSSSPGDPSNNAFINLSPLPTVVPLEFGLSSDSANQPASTTETLAPTAQALRKVSIATPTAQAPVIHEVTIGQQSSGGGGGGGGAPAAKTGSSR